MFLVFFSFRGQIRTSYFLNLTYWRPSALFSALHLLPIAQWGALQNMWVPEHHQLGPEVHVQCVDARGQAMTRLPSKCCIPVTAYNHQSLVTSLLTSLPSCHEGFHSWFSFMSCYLKGTDLCQHKIPHTVHECHGAFFRGSRFSPFGQLRCHCLIANYRQGRLWICAKVPFPWLHVGYYLVQFHQAISS